MNTQNTTGTNIQLGTIVARERRARGLTQEALAEWLGVTKAAVSKWELGLSLPDVAMLPRIASQFGLSVDELIGYHPQLSDKELTELQDRIAALAATDRAAAFELCEQVVHEHASCWPALLLVAGTLVGWATIASIEQHLDEAAGYRARALDLIGRILDHANDAAALSQATQLKASLLMAEACRARDAGDDESSMAKLDKAIALLEPLMPKGGANGVAMMLASLYQQRGDTERALAFNQRRILEAAAALTSNLAIQLDLREEPAAIEELVRTAEDAMRALHWQRANPTCLASLHISAAQALMRASTEEDDGSRSYREAHSKALTRADAAEDALAHLRQAVDAALDPAAQELPALTGLAMFDHIPNALGDGISHLTGKPASSYLLPAIVELLEKPCWESLADNPSYQQLIERVRAAGA